MPTRVCACALRAPLDGHDRDPAQWAVVEQLVADLGEFFLVTIDTRHFRVSRYCVALHGVRAETIDDYGFEEIGA